MRRMTSMKREEQIAAASYVYGMRGSSIDFAAGAKWADANQKSPWISVEDDLPCNHEELIDNEIPTYTFYVVVGLKDGSVDLSRIIKLPNDNWVWTLKVSHWFPIPKLPKE